MAYWFMDKLLMMLVIVEILIENVFAELISKIAVKNQLSLNRLNNLLNYLNC